MQYQNCVEVKVGKAQKNKSAEQAVVTDRTNLITLIKSSFVTVTRILMNYEFEIKVTVT